MEDQALYQRLFRGQRTGAGDRALRGALLERGEFVLS
jgi:hypothetical protein